MFSGKRDYTPAAEALIEARIEARGSSRCGHTWTDVLSLIDIEMLIFSVSKGEESTVAAGTRLRLVPLYGDNPEFQAWKCQHRNLRQHGGGLEHQHAPASA